VNDVSLTSALTPSILETGSIAFVFVKRHPAMKIVEMCPTSYYGSPNELRVLLRNARMIFEDMTATVQLPFVCVLDNGLFGIRVLMTIDETSDSLDWTIHICEGTADMTASTYRDTWLNNRKINEDKSTMKLTSTSRLNSSWAFRHPYGYSFKVNRVERPRRA
jgi:hypothetical protein